MPRRRGKRGGGTIVERDGRYQAQWSAAGSRQGRRKAGTEVTTPKRIQRQRTKGWRMPEGAVYVGRPTRWGNHFRDAEWYRAWLTGQRSHAGIPMPFAALPPKPDLEPLRGHDLACWCSPDQPCHADVLLELANFGPVGSEIGSVEGSKHARHAQ